MKIAATFIALALAQPSAALADTTTEIYQASLGTPPDQQHWIYLSDPLIGGQSRFYMGDGAVILNSMAVTKEKAGFFSRIPVAAQDLSLTLPRLNRQDGFELKFRLKLIREHHDSDARAGFSIIVLADDHRGIELAFWPDEIWAQADAPIFSHGEGVSVATDHFASYRLAIAGDNYQLWRQDDELILSGQVKDYSSFGRPYTLNNFIFFGDDTSSASAEAAVEFLSLRTATRTAEQSQAREPVHENVTDDQAPIAWPLD